MNPEIFSIGIFSIRWYSVLILLGIVVAYVLAVKEAEKFNISQEFIFDLAFWVLIFGILGARLYYVLFNLSSYLDDPLSIFAVWEGGLAIHGGIIFGLITLIIYCKTHHESVIRMMDIAVPSLIIAQAIGRWGNFFNSEAHGFATTLTNLQSLHIPNFIIQGMQINGIYYHPTFFYESIWCVLGFIVLILVRKYYRYLKAGQLSCIYLMWYGVGRYFIESLRTDSLMFYNFKVAQLVSLVTFAIGFIVFIYLCFNRLKKGLYYPKKNSNLK